MKTISDISEMQLYCLALREAGTRIAFVPTMGYLHEGHLSLLQEGRRRGDVLVLSIFVNPAQFGAGEDLDSYPRDLERDEALARTAGVDLVFYPRTEDVYPAGFSTWLAVQGELTETLEGACRPGHFRGVATVVAKLFNIVQPHLALFGRKDFQQLAMIERMVLDFNVPVEIVGMPIVREPDGLAMSSRNVYLSADERTRSLALVASLRQSAGLYAAGETNAVKILEAARERLLSEPGLMIDYVKICHRRTLRETEVVDDDSVMLLAVKVGRTRLIDNHILSEEV
jgi:pantoate--beta-alanine ligase